MPELKQPSGLTLYYEEHGEGFPILCFAPGGLWSAISCWEGRPPHLIELLSPHFRVIVMDQRNAGRSHAPITGEDGWHNFTADHIALLDHLGIETCYIAGMCIGCSFSLALAKAAPERVAKALLLQPLGLSPTNRPLFYDLFSNWVISMREQHPDMSEADWSAFRSRLYDGDFTFSVSRDFVRSCQTPMLVLMGNDQFHPSEISREVVDLAPHARLVEQWKEGDALVLARQEILAFFRKPAPVRAS
jgi:pimeloyl-ACP methyl ester carboxylesterase